MLGRFRKGSRTPVLNPRLEKILGLPTGLPEDRRIVLALEDSNSEALRVVDALLASNNNSDNRTSDFMPKRGNATPRSRNGGNKNLRSRKRKRRSGAETGGAAQLGVFGTDEFVEEAATLKRMCESKSQLEFGGGPELNSEFANSSSMCDESYFKNNSYDDLFRTNLYPQDMFSFQI